MNTIYEMNEISGSQAQAKGEIKRQTRQGARILAFMLLGLVVVGVLSGMVGQSVLGSAYYSVFADFDSVQGLRQGDDIEISGVRVGRVGSIFLAENDMARVEMRIKNDIPLPEDSIASISMRGLLGEKAVKILPGGSPDLIAPMGILQETESGLDLSDMLGQAFFGKL